MPENSTSVLDNKANRLFNYPLTIKQQIWLHYVIPGLSLSTLHIFNLILDLGVVVVLLNARKYLSGLATLCLMYLPAATIYLRQISKPPSSKNFKSRAIWITTETGHLILFPSRLFSHLAAKLFWLIEILRFDDKIEDNLRNYETNTNEPALTYLFVMIFLQNIPQTLLQIYLLARETSNSNSINILQYICTLVSLLVGSVGAASYHRYESQVRAAVRQPVWPTEANENRPSTCRHQTQPLVPTQPTSRQNKGLQDNTPVGNCLLVVFWFLFLLGRTLSVGNMLNSYPRVVMLVLNVHLLLFYLYYSTYPTIGISNKILLSCASLFVVIEVGVKFQRTVYLYMLFIVASLVEDVGFTLICYVWAGRRMRWHNYAAYTVINAHLLALIVFAYYMAFEKPKTVHSMRHRSSVRTSTRGGD